MLATITYKTCQKCLEPKPLTNYRRRWRDRDVRMNVCNSCHYASERARRVRKKQEALDRVVTNFIRRWKRGKSYYSRHYEHYAGEYYRSARKQGVSNRFLESLIERIGMDEALRAYRGQRSQYTQSERGRAVGSSASS